ncbi:MAG: DNA primase [Eubacteriales bacterium]|nr:DNA primase [Eubacteriales bacterium]
MRYEDDLVEEVREKNDIVDVISQYVSLKKKGASYFGLCPFHNEKSPSFSVSREKQLYYCFGCGQGGNVYTFLMEYNRLSFVEALEELAGRAGMTLPQREQTPEERQQADGRILLKEMNKKAAVYFHYLLHTKRGEKAMEYLRGRGLTQETIRHFGLGYADIYRDDLYQYLKKEGYKDEQLKESSLVTVDAVRGSYDKFFHRVIFPIMDVNQRVIGFGGRVLGEGEPKYLNSKETLLFDKGRNLYGLNYAKRSRERAIILCEGYMDVISLHQAGFTNAVAPLGTAFTPQQAMLLKRYTSEVILSFDSDGAGVKAALRALPILRENGLRGRVLSMKPYKDPDELIKAEGQEAYRKRMEEAEPGRMFELLVLCEQYNQKDPESRTEFIKAVAKNLAQIEEPVERGAYLDAAANRFMIVKKDLEELVEKYGMGLSYEKVNEQYKTSPETRESRQEKKEKYKNQPQRILLTWLTEHPDIYPLVRPYVKAEDFLTPLYHSVAVMLFSQLEEEGSVNPARILSQFTQLEEQREVSAIFNTHLKYETSPEDRSKALSDVVKKIRLAGIEDAMSRTGDIVKWQELLSQKNKIQKLYISLEE